MEQPVFAQSELSPGSVAAGDSVEFVVTLIAGSGYTTGPSRIVYDLPGTLGMSRPSLLHREEAGFVEVYVTNPDVTYGKRIWDLELCDFASGTQRSWRGRAQRMVVLDLSAGVREGDVIELRWGDTGGGYGEGTKVTTVVPVPDYRAVLDVRYFCGLDRGLPDMGRSFKGCERPVPDCEISLSFRIVAREPHHLRVIRKVDKALLLPHDRFWNVAAVADIGQLVETPGVPDRNALGVFEYRDKNVQILSRGLPLRDAPRMDNVFEGMNLYWGDVHTHSAISRDCIEREKLQQMPGDLMAFARHRAGLDFFAVTDHHQPWGQERKRIGEANWRKTVSAIREHDRPGEFLVFPGVEFRCPRGDTAVVFNWLPEYAEIDRPEWNDVRKLWAGLAGKDYLTIPHFHSLGALAEGEWWDAVEAGVEPVIEVYSCHGSYEREGVLESGRAAIKRFRSDRNAAFFLSHGYRYGLVANSDGHKGHVGTNGLTAVFARSLDKASVLEAYRRRHVYGTTNARIRLVFTGNGRLMGSVVPNTPEKRFVVDVMGENELKRIDLVRNGVPFRCLVPDGRAFRVELAVPDPLPSNWYVRATQVDNHVAYSSPIWFE